MLGALTDEYKLSDPVGHQMARLPLDPTHSKALILASQFNCLEEMLIAVAMLSVESIFYTPREKLEEVSINDVFLMHVACVLTAVTLCKVIVICNYSEFKITFVSRRFELECLCWGNST